MCLRIISMKLFALHVMFYVHFNDPAPRSWRELNKTNKHQWHDSVCYLKARVAHLNRVNIDVFCQTR
jgi:hypothetical protein